MGCDIHSVCQVLTDKGWKTVATGIGGDVRNYQAFDVLCGVRGYRKYKFSKPRGLPEGFEMGTIHLYPEYHGTFYMGDHSYSYITLEELRKHLLTIPDAKMSECESWFSDVIIEMERHGGYGRILDSHCRLVFGFDS